MKFSGIRFLASAALLGVTPLVNAATLTWDADTVTTGAQDGAGTWSAAGTNWWNGTANTTFTTGDNVIFGSAAGNTTYTIALNSPVSAANISFDPTNSFARYSVNLQGNTLTLTGLLTLNAQSNAYYQAFSDSVGGGALVLNRSGTSQSTPDIAYTQTGSGDYGATIGATLNVGSGSRYFVGTTGRNDVARYSGDLRFDGAILGSANIFLSGTGTSSSHNMHFVFNGANTAFTGGVTLGANTDLALTNNAALSAVNSLTFNATGTTRATLLLYGHNLTIGSLNDTSAAGATRWIRNGSTNTTNGGTNSQANASSVALGLNADSVLTVNQTTDGVFGGVISNGGTDNAASAVDNSATYRTLGVTKTGSATLMLTGANSYTGATTITAGRLRVNGSLGASSAVSVANGAILAGSGTVGGAVTVASGGVIEAGSAGSGSLTIANSLTFSGAGAVNITSLGTYTSSAAVIVTGNVVTSGGAGSVTLNLGGAANGTYKLIAHANSFADLSAFTVVAGLTSRQTGQLVNNAGSLDYLITGDTPYWTGAQSNAWTTNTVGGAANWKLVTAGTNTEYLANDVVIFNDNASGSGAVTVNIADANVSPTGVTFANATRDYTLTASSTYGITGGVTLVKSGAGKVTVNNANTYSGGTTLSAGTLVAGNNAAFGSGVIAINGGNLDLNGRTLANGITGGGGTIIGSGTLAGVIASGTLVYNSSGNTLVLTGTNTYGATTLTAGTLQVGAGGTAGTLGSGAVTNSGTLAFNRSDAITVANAISGAGTINKLGASSLTLSGANSGFTGVINVNGGPTGTGTFNSNAAALTASNAAALGSAAINFGSTQNLRALSLNFTGTINNVITLNAADAGTVTVTSGDAGHTVNLAGKLTGGTANTILQFDVASANPSSSWMRLANATNDFVVSKISMNRGGIAVTGDGSLGNAANVLELNQGGANSGGLRFDGAAVNILHAVSLADNSWVELYGDNAGTNTTFATNSGAISGNISGAGTFGLFNQRVGGAATSTGGSGTGSLTLRGNNTFAGTVTVTNATRLIAASVSALGNAATINVNAGALQIGETGGALAVSNAGNIALTGGTLDLATATGTVTLTLAATKTLTADAASTVRIGFGDSIVITGGGASLLNGILNLAGEYDNLTGTHSYTLISATGGSTLSGNFGSITGYDAGKITASFDALTGMLTVTAVPEPATYGLLGAGALAAAALVRRRRRGTISA